MDCLNCDNDNHNHSRTEYVSPTYTDRELKQMLKQRQLAKIKENAEKKHNDKIYKQIAKLKKKLK